MPNVLNVSEWAALESPQAMNTPAISSQKFGGQVSLPGKLYIGGLGCFWAPGYGWFERAVLYMKVNGRFWNLPLAQERR